MAFSWRKYLKHAAIAGVLGLALVMFGLVLWGVLTHEEGGLLEVCWEGNEARYVRGAEVTGGTCLRPEKLVWAKKQIPIALAALSVEGRPLSETDPETGVLARAVDGLNWQVGFTLFQAGSGRAPAAAKIHFGQPYRLGPDEPPVPAGHVQHQLLGRVDRGALLLRADVYLRADVAVSDRLLHAVLEHELLHLAGLAHDDFPASIMYPLTADDWNLDWLQASHLTDHDVKLLRRLYHTTLSD